jgi:hypothetical protein
MYSGKIAVPPGGGGIVNNNNVAVEENFQRRFSVNVWCGIFGDRMDLWVPFY